MTLFIGVHLFNHLYALMGADKHIALMNTLRQFYRHFLFESLLLTAVVAQIISGFNLFKTQRPMAVSFFEKLHVWTGLYLAFFLVVHLSAILAGRYVLHLDTNFYFGVAGLNTSPFNLFFTPYYGLAIFSFFGHIAAIHAEKMKKNVLGFSPNLQAKGVLLIGIILIFFVFKGLTNDFQGVTIPNEYSILIGKY